MQTEVLPECSGGRTHHRADTIYLLVMGGRVIAMQTGFALLEAGYGRPMNSANIMMKNIMDLLLGVFVFYLIGFQIGFGAQSEWIENFNFDYALWFLHFSYATTSATIISGAVGGRVSFFAYLALSCVVTGVIYPVCVSWTWGGGWLAELGYVDFAGSSIVHMVGATCAFVSVCICGPRVGRFPEYRSWRGVSRWIFVERNNSEFYQMPLSEVEKAIFSPIKLCSNPVQLLFGTFLLLLGFMAFNPASTFATTLDADALAARVTVVTMISASGGAAACVVVSLFQFRSFVITVPMMTNAVLGGLIASCAPCHAVPPPMGLVVGFIGGLLTLGFEPLMAKFQLDDVVGAVAVHGIPGIWGVLSVPIFAKPHCQSQLRGLVFGGGQEAWRLLCVQAVGLVTMAAFAFVSTYVCIVLIDIVGGFRCSRAAELIGLDFIEHHIDDGSLRLDTTKVAVLHHTPQRDCLVTRVKNRTISPTKAYLEEKVPEHQKESSRRKLEPEETLDAEAEAKAQLGRDQEAQMHAEILRLKEGISKLTATLSMFVHGMRGDRGSFKDLGFIGGCDPEGAELSNPEQGDPGRKEILEALMREAQSAAATAEAQSHVQVIGAQAMINE